MGIDEIITGTIGFAIAMVMVGAAIGGLIYGYYLYVQHQVLANYLWPVVDVIPYGSGYYMAVINAGHEPFFVKYVIYSNGQSQAVKSGVLYHNQYWTYQSSLRPAAVMVCSALDTGVCVVEGANGWSVIDDAPPGSGWVNITLIVDCWASGSVSWVGVGDNKGVSGSLDVTPSTSLCSIGAWGSSASRDVFTYGPLLIEVSYSYSYPQMSCHLEISPNVQPILLSTTASPYNPNWSYTYILIASPNTDLTIHVACTYTPGYW